MRGFEFLSFLLPQGAQLICFPPADKEQFRIGKFSFLPTHTQRKKSRLDRANGDCSNSETSWAWAGVVIYAKRFACTYVQPQELSTLQLCAFGRWPQRKPSGLSLLEYSAWSLPGAEILRNRQPKVIRIPTESWNTHFRSY